MMASSLLARSAFVLLITTAGLRLDAQVDSGPPPRPEVRTVGSAERSVPPDKAILTLSLAAVGASPAIAGRIVATRSDSLRRALQSLGIPGDSLISRSGWYWWRGRIEHVVSEPRWIPTPNSTPGAPQGRQARDTTFRVTDAIEVRISDLTKAGAAIDTALAHGVTEIGGPRFSASDITTAQDAALREATERARRQAAAIAEASGGRLGRALLLSTQQERDYSFYETTLSDSAGESAQRGTEIIRPSISVRVTVYGRWELIGRP